MTHPALAGYVMWREAQHDPLAQTPPRPAARAARRLQRNEKLMRESAIEAYLKAECEGRGALVRKLTYIGRRGAPDRLVVWPEDPDRFAGDGLPALVDFVELKAPGKRPDDLQEREIARLRSMGCAVFVLDSVEAVDAYVKGRS